MFSVYICVHKLPVCNSWSSSFPTPLFSVFLGCAYALNFSSSHYACVAVVILYLLSFARSLHFFLFAFIWNTLFHGPDAFRAHQGELSVIFIQFRPGGVFLLSSSRLWKVLKCTLKWSRPQGRLWRVEKGWSSLSCVSGRVKLRGLCDLF